MNNIENQYTQENLTAWLVEKISTYVKHPINDIQTDQPMSEYGLDSVYVFTLVGEIEDYLNITLDPTIMWDYPTIAALTQKLLGEVGQITTEVTAIV